MIWDKAPYGRNRFIADAQFGRYNVVRTSYGTWAAYLMDASRGAVGHGPAVTCRVDVGFGYKTPDDAKAACEAHHRGEPPAVEGTTPQELTVADGWAIVNDDGEINVRTISDTRRAAIVNWLCVDKGLMATTLTSYGQIERMWEDYRTTETVRRVSIRALLKESIDDLDDGRIPHARR